MRRTQHFPGQRAAGEPPDWEPTYAAFLEQSRWLLDQEQRRSAGFQANAIALLGFAGVVLGILVTNGFLAGARWASLTGALSRVAVVLFAAGAVVAGFALMPRRTGSVNIEDTIDDWAALHDEDATKPRPVQHFTNMLLATDAKPVDPVGNRRRWRRHGPPAVRAQALREARSLADHRARRAGLSAKLMAAGVVALTLVVILPRDAPVTSPTPTQSATSTK